MRSLFLNCDRFVIVLTADQDESCGLTLTSPKFGKIDTILDPQLCYTHLHVMNAMGIADIDRQRVENNEDRQPHHQHKDRILIECFHALSIGWNLTSFKPTDRTQRLLGRYTSTDP